MLCAAISSSARCCSGLYFFMTIRFIDKSMPGSPGLIHVSLYSNLPFDSNCNVKEDVVFCKGLGNSFDMFVKSIGSAPPDFINPQLLKATGGTTSVGSSYTD